MKYRDTVGPGPGWGSCTAVLCCAVLCWGCFGPSRLVLRANHAIPLPARFAEKFQLQICGKRMSAKQTKQLLKAACVSLSASASGQKLRCRALSYLMVSRGPVVLFAARP
eukprot:COSAG01_NODE_534_length_15805_cov_9.468420_11_plen_110_part_00